MASICPAFVVGTFLIGPFLIGPFLIGPFLISPVRESTGSFSWALIAVAGFPILGAVLIRVVGISMRPAPAGQPDTVHA